MPDAILSTATTNFSDVLTTLVKRQVGDLLRADLAWMPEGAVKRDGYEYAAGDLTFTVPYVGEVGDAGALQEGVTPATLDLPLDSESFSIAQRGLVIKITDRAVKQHPSSENLLQIAVERASRSAAVDANEIAKAVWGAATPGFKVIYAGSGNAAPADVAAGDVLTLANVRLAAQWLANASVPRIGGLYTLIGSGRVLAGLKADSAFVDLVKYKDSMAQFVQTNEIGQIAGCRVIEVPDTQGIIDEDGGTTSAPVETVIVTGAEALVFADEGSLSAAFVPPKPSADDPLGQRAYVGWSAYYGAGAIFGIEGHPRFVQIVASAPALAGVTTITE